MSFIIGFLAGMFGGMFGVGGGVVVLLPWSLLELPEQSRMA
jgi:uncharacterized membrane protein YfcA